MNGKILTLQQINREGKETLERAGIAEAGLDAWYLLEYVTGISRASYYGDPGRVVTEEDLAVTESVLKKSRAYPFTAYHRRAGVYGAFFLGE